jgi:glycosyltransferase involved in cell wall biosynthesis
MTKVLHIIEQLSDFGGTARKLLYLTEENDEHNVVFATYLPSTMLDEFTVKGAKIYNIKSLYLLTLIIKIYGIAKKEKIKLICTHFTRPLVIGYFLTKILKVPIVHFEHSPNFRHGLSKILVNRCLPSVTKIICNSHYTADSISNAYKQPKDKIRVVHNPVKERENLSKENNKRESYDIARDDIVIGHVGGLVGWRDQLCLIRAFSLVKKEFDNVYLIIIGEGPEREYLERECENLKIALNVIFVGYTNEIGDYLKIMDIYVNPALEEGFGIAVVEAMLAKLPVILACSGAHPELIENNIEGLLYKPSDHLDLARSLIQLIQSPKPRIEMGNNARKKAKTKFSVSNYVKSYQMIINDYL